MPKITSQFYEFGAFSLDAKRRLLLRDKQPVPLTSKAFDTLLLLVENSQRVLEKDELMKTLWPNSFVEEDNLAQNISALRKALGESPSDHRYIVTVPGRGYRFVAEVRQAGEDADELVVEKRTVSRVIIEEAQGGEELGKGAGQIGEGEPVAPVCDRRNESALIERRYSDASGAIHESPLRKRWVTALGGGVLAALAALLIGLNAGGLRDRLLGRPSVVPIRSLAVLPLENLSSDPSQEYFADGMTDELITDLAQIGSLRVISRTSSMRYKGSGKPLSQIAHELNVDALVEGTVVRSGDRVRITAQLIHAPTDRHLWAASYARDFRDVLALQDDVAGAIAHAVQAKLTPEVEARLSKSRRVNPEAYENYLRGGFHRNQNTEADIRESINDFEAAIKQDPSFALAYADLAESYVFAVYSSLLAPNEFLPKAKSAAAKALEIDDSLAQAHASRALVAMVFDRDWPGAEKEIRRAIELNPSNASAHLWAMIYLQDMGQPAKAIEEGEKALELDPYSPLSNRAVSWRLAIARQYDRAIEVDQRMGALGAPSAELDIQMGVIHSFQGRYDLAIAELQGSVSAPNPNPFPVAVLAHAYAAVGRRPQAERLLEEVQEQSRHRYVSRYFWAIVYTGLKNKDRAMVCLEEAYEEHSPWMIDVALNPLLNPLHSDPRFQDLVRRIGLPP